MYFKCHFNDKLYAYISLVYQAFDVSLSKSSPSEKSISENVTEHTIMLSTRAMVESTFTAVHTPEE